MSDQTRQERCDRNIEVAVDNLGLADDWMQGKFGGDIHERIRGAEDALTAAGIAINLASELAKGGDS